jgi:hypothetical protein
MPIAHFTIKNRFQKGGLYQTLLTSTILTDICLKVTGQTNYTVDFIDEVNKGRLATIEFQGTISYISFSENNIGGRNASFQSFPSALLRFHQEPNQNKKIYFYFLQNTGSNNETDYFLFMYRLMKTAGTEFLNENDHLTNPISPFNTVADIIAQRNLNRGRNSSNNSSYLTVDENNILQVYGKTYGASKYETTLLCLAISEITSSKIELYEIKEGNLTMLPALAREVILDFGKIDIITSDLTLERTEFEENDSLRSPTYIYNLLEKLGDKKCTLCDCEIPQIIQGAHIWPVASIKRRTNISAEQKLQYAIDGDNGLWLCNNHHKLFDINLLLINDDGRIKYKTNLRDIDESYINSVTITHQVREDILTPNFLQHLQNRNSLIDQTMYSFVD